MQAASESPIQFPKALRPRRVPEPGDAMDPTQTKLYLMMAIVSLLFAAQLATQTGAFAALP
jgi:hypothetical protein